MKLTKLNYSSFEALYGNNEPFNFGFIELLTKNNSDKYEIFGFIHSENPLDLNKIYIKIQKNPAGSNYPDQKGGVKLKDYIQSLKNHEIENYPGKEYGVELKELISFLQDLYEEELKIRKLKE